MPAIFSSNPAPACGLKMLGDHFHQDAVDRLWLGNDLLCLHKKDQGHKFSYGVPIQ